MENDKERAQDEPTGTSEISEEDLGKITGGTMSVQDWLGGTKCGNILVVSEIPGPHCTTVYDGAVKTPEVVPN
jgi:hypothetical protein